MEKITLFQIFLYGYVFPLIWTILFTQLWITFRDKKESHSKREYIRIMTFGISFIPIFSPIVFTVEGFSEIWEDIEAWWVEKVRLETEIEEKQKQIHNRFEMLDL